MGDGFGVGGFWRARERLLFALGGQRAVEQSCGFGTDVKCHVHDGDQDVPVEPSALAEPLETCGSARVRQCPRQRLVQQLRDKLVVLTDIFQRSATVVARAGRGREPEFAAGYRGMPAWERLHAHGRERVVVSVAEKIGDVIIGPGNVQLVG